MYSRKYKTMRRNSRRYVPKHLKASERTFSLREYMGVVKVIIILFVLTFSLSIYFTTISTIQVNANANNTLVTKNTNTEVITNKLVKLDKNLPGTFPVTLGGTEPTIVPVETETVYKSLEILSSPDEKEIKVIESTDPVEEVHKPTLEEQLGNSIIELDTGILVKHDLPNKYYPGLDFSSFQPYMCYTAITNKSAPAYHVVNSDDCYTDELGFRRYKTNDSQFTINGQDDYVIALGTFYKEKGLVGNRYLIVTSTGMYTAITGDEKSDRHTDSMHMFTMHDGDTKAGIIEWIVDQPRLAQPMKGAGTVTVGGPEVLQGEILHIYELK